MGDINQLEWVRSHADLVREPILEVGSRHYSADVSMDYRSVRPGLEFIGSDMLPGKNVDVVADFSEPFDALYGRFGQRDFQTVICCSVLEHCAQVHEVARNISRITAPGGSLFVSIPFIWRFHGYPNDYFRATPEGVKQLFPEYDFSMKRSTLSSNMPGDVRPLPEDPEGVNQFIMRHLMNRPASSFGGRFRRAARRVYRVIRGRASPPAAANDPGRYQGLSGYRYVLIPTNINMVGIKRL